MTELKRKVFLNSETTNFREMVYTCYQCGVCSGGCPVALLENGFRPREIVQKTQHEKISELANDPVIWMCAACYNCYEHCPQNVKVTDVIMELQSEALKMGVAPQKFQKIMGMVYKNALTNTLVGFISKQREKAGLTEPPTPNVKAAQSIMEKTGVVSLLKLDGGKK